MKQLYAVIVTIFTLFAVSVNAQTFSWGNQTNGNTSNTQNNSGITMTMNMGGTGLTYSWPRYNSAGGGNLATTVDWSNKTSSVTCTITFSKPLVGIAFLLFDVDQTITWDDKVTVTAVNGGGSVVYPSITGSSFATVTGANNNVLEGTGNNADFANSPSVVSFGSHPVKTITIVYGAGSSSPSNPASQVIGIGNVVYENVLPLSLTAFGATKKNNAVELKWEAENQDNFSHFELERSANGTDGFEKIAVVNATTVQKGNYSYTDFGAARLMQKAFYRLKMVDNDGSFSYSNVVMQAFENNATVMVSPTLLNAGEMISVNIAGSQVKYDAKLFDMSGKLISQQSGNSRMQFATSGLRKGMYIVNVTGTNGQVVSSKVMVN